MGFNIRRPFHRSTTSEVTSVEGSEPSNEDTKNSNELPGKSTTGDAKVSGAEVVTELTEFKKLHQWDPNLPEGIQTEVDNALRTGDLEEELALDHELNQEDSIYPEGIGLHPLSQKPWKKNVDIVQFEPQFETTMRMFLPTPSEPGLLE